MKPEKNRIFMGSNFTKVLWIWNWPHKQQDRKNFRAAANPLFLRSEHIAHSVEGNYLFIYFFCRLKSSLQSSRNATGRYRRFFSKSLTLILLTSGNTGTAREEQSKWRQQGLPQPQESAMSMGMGTGQGWAGTWPQVSQTCRDWQGKAELWGAAQALLQCHWPRELKWGPGQVWGSHGKKIYIFKGGLLSKNKYA